MNKLLTALFIVFITLFSASCNKNKPTDSFGKKEMFTNYADNLILPSYTTYGTALNGLQTALNNFNSSPDLTSLAALQQASKAAYTAWQSCEVYSQTPPANDIMALEYTNYYPCRKDSVEAYVSRNDNSLSFIKSRIKSDRGLAVLDYILFNGIDQQAILDKLTTNVNATSYRTYISSILSNLIEINNQIVTTWNTTYRQTFINNLGTDASSAFSVLVNSFAQSADDLKRMQVGTPAGYLGNVATVNTIPTAAQAYYSNNSINFMLLSLNNLKAALNGTASTDGKGLLDYIGTLNVTSTFGGNLRDDILNQIDLCITKVNDCAPNFATTIISNKPKADALFLETKKLLVLMKVDVPSALGVSITYTDSDGD